ncbi:Splicing factor [Collariella sp. IMI 366227]|nr:Splicing factor [Collariella sp. IMI 366227]
MNDARLRSVLSSATSDQYPIVKLVLHPKHGGAIIEFANAAAANKANMAIDGLEVQVSEEEGGNRRLKTGTVAELFKGKGEKRGKKAAGGAGLMPPPPVLVKRPGPGGKTGPKRLLGFVGGVKKSAGAGEEANGTYQGAKAEGKKSNADFKKMFLGGGNNTIAATAVENGEGKEADGDGKMEVDTEGNGSTN